MPHTKVIVDGREVEIEEAPPSRFPFFVQLGTVLACASVGWMIGGESRGSTALGGALVGWILGYFTAFFADTVFAVTDGVDQENARRAAAALRELEGREAAES